MVVPQDGIADSTEMANTKAKRQKTLAADLPSGFGGWIKALESNYPKYYLSEVSAMCKANGTQLIFLYLPPYGAAAPRPQESAFFEGLGPTWIPPDSIFGNPKLHFDNSHLNMRGAAQLSDWLSAQIAALPR